MPEVHEACGLDVDGMYRLLGELQQTGWIEVSGEYPFEEIRLIREIFNVADYFVDRHVREGRGQKTAIRCEGQSFTYAQMAERVNRAGNGLLGMGVRPGDRVVLILPDGPEFVAAYFGAMKIGAIAVPTNTALRPADYEYLVNESQAAAVLTSVADNWLAAQSPELEAEATTKDDPAFWLWTSGSTGMPKAAVHRHRDWLCCCENYARGVLGIVPDDVTFSSSKLFHAYGLGNGLMFPFYVGATTILYPGRPQAAAILAKAQETRPTLFFSVPTLYASMLQETGYDLSSIRLAVSAAEPLPAEIFRRWKARFGFEILDGIGSTEVLHIYLSARAGKVRPGSTGQPVPGYDIRIMDHDGIGDLLVRGESLTPCYWNRPELTAQRIEDGWFHSGDKYSVDADGYYWYAGRTDDMLRVSGQWVSPIEVESALAEHDAVLEAAVVAYKEPGGLYTSKAFVVLKNGLNGTEGLAQELQAFVKQRITPYKYPRHIEFLAELPKSAAGKLLRYKLRELDATASTAP